MPPPLDRVGITVGWWHLRHLWWFMADLSIALLGGQAAVGAANRRSQIFVGSLSVGQKLLNVCVSPNRGVKDVLPIGGRIRRQVRRRRCKAGRVADRQVMIASIVAKRLEPCFDRGDLVG